MKMKLKARSVRAMLLGALLAPIAVSAATNDLSSTLSKGLFEEEANHNLPEAIRMYQQVVDRFDTDRKLAATAVFRLGECYRKQGGTNQAAAQYQRVLREFPDQAPLVSLSRQYLAGWNQGPGESNQLAPFISATNAHPMAAGRDETANVEAIIKNSPDLINAPDQTGHTLLQTYAGRGDLAVVKLLLDNGALANGSKHPDITPLHFAVGNGHKAVVDLLLSKGASASVKTESGVTPLHLAVLKGYELVAKDLLAAGAPVNAAVENEVNHSPDPLGYSFHRGETPLQTACENGYHSLVDLLLKNGADPNSSLGAPLFVSTSAKDEALVKTLLDAHADPNVGRGRAIAVAAGAGHAGILDLLLSKTAVTNLSAGLEAAVVGKHPDVIKKLIGFKADPNIKTANGVPLIFVALADSPTLLALLEGGANPNLPSGVGWPVQSAVKLPGDETQSLEILLNHGADPNSIPTQGFPALHIAAINGSIEAARLLLKHGAKVDLRTATGDTPLHEAVRYGRYDIAALLLDSGADPNVRDNSGQTPLDMTKLPGRTTIPMPIPAGNGAFNWSSTVAAQPANIVELLRQHGATEDLAHFDRIETRSSPNGVVAIFDRPKDDVNRFSLLELLAVQYGLVSRLVDLDRSQHRYQGSSRTPIGALPFPNLDQVEIRRPKPDGKEWSRIPVPVKSILESGDCLRDVWLQWGDQVELEQADHPLAEQWQGFSKQIFTNLQNCLRREVQITIKGQSTNLVLEFSAPAGRYTSLTEFDYSPPQFYLLPVLQNSRLLRTSSDLSRVKVVRNNSATGENWVKIFDCSTPPIVPLWLRDGDAIEVPDRP